MAERTLLLPLRGDDEEEADDAAVALLQTRGKISGTFPMVLPGAEPRDVYAVAARKGAPIYAGDDVAFPWDVLWLEERDGGHFRLPMAASPYRRLDAAAAVRAVLEATGLACDAARILRDVDHRGKPVTLVSVSLLEALPTSSARLAPEYVGFRWLRWLCPPDRLKRFDRDDLRLVAQFLEPSADMV